MEKKLEIGKLIPTQHYVRDIDIILSMIFYLSEDGIFDSTAVDEFGKTRGRQNNPLISICEFEDGALYIRDGHHRIIAIFLAGRDFLYSHEYTIEKRKYEDFSELSEKSILSGWITPFDPRVDIRIADFSEFKKEIPKELDKAIPYIKKAWESGAYLRKREETKCYNMEDYLNKVSRAIEDYLWR